VKYPLELNASSAGKALNINNILFSGCFSFVHGTKKL
jgi:hypothetical protein